MHDEMIRSRRGPIRLGLFGFGAVQITLGLWMLIDARGFYGSFPGGGLEWASSYGPYNEHMLTDIGGLFLATGAVLLLAAWWMSRQVVQAALIAYILFGAPHFLYHLGADGVLPGWEAIASPLVTGSAVIAALALLLLAGRREAPLTAPASSTPPATRLVPRRGGWLARIGSWYARLTYGVDVVSARVLAHTPALAIGYGAFEFATERASAVDDHLKLLALVKTATVVNCEWCIDFGSYVAHRRGIDEDQLRELHRYHESSAFDADERLVLDYAVAMTQTPAQVNDELFARLRERFNDAQLVELTSAIGIENFRARFNQAAGIAAEGFSSATACALAAPGARAAA